MQRKDVVLRLISWHGADLQWLTDILTVDLLKEDARWMPQTNPTSEMDATIPEMMPQSNQSPKEDANLLDGCHNPINLPKKMPTSWMDATIQSISQWRCQPLGWMPQSNQCPNEDANLDGCLNLNLPKEDPTSRMAQRRRCQPKKMSTSPVPQSPQRRCQPQSNLLKEDANHNPISSKKMPTTSQSPQRRCATISSKKMPTTIQSPQWRC